MAKLNRNVKVNAEVVVVSKTPQVIALVEILKAANPTTEEEIRVAVEQNAVKLHTRQDPWLIFAYYRKVLVDAGFLVVDGLRQWTRVAVTSTYWNYEGC